VGNATYFDLKMSIRFLYITTAISVGGFGYYYWSSGRGSLSAAVVLATIFCVSAVCSRLIAVSISSSILGWVGRVAAALVDVSFAVLWLSLLALFTIALLSWGQIPTIDLLSPYVYQLPTVLDTLGIRMFWFWALLAMCCMLLVGLVGWISTETGTTSSTLKQWIQENPLVRAPLLCVIATVGIASVLPAYLTSPLGHNVSEPISLMLVPSARVDIQSNSMTANQLSELRSLESQAANSHPDSTKNTRRNVILITVDALRPDRMGIYGHQRPTTPFLSEFIKTSNSSMISRARSTCAESMCGIVSLLNGRSSHHSPWISFGLPDVLKRAGYTTIAALGGDHTNFYGLRERIGTFDTYSDGVSAGADPRMNDDAYVVERLRAQVPVCDAKPLFLFVHLMSAHVLGKKHSTFAKWLPVKSPARLLVGEIDSQSKTEMQNFYDNGVLQADHYISQIHTLLSEKKCLKNSLVIVTADHGEFLGEHGRVQHAATVLDPVLRIPWLMHGFDISPPNLDLPVLQEDLAPTVLTQLGIPIPATWRGQALQRPIVRPYSFHTQGVWTCLIDYRSSTEFKYIIDRNNQRAIAYKLPENDGENQDWLASTPTELIREWNTLLLQERLLTPMVDKAKSSNADLFVKPSNLSLN
jgi:glucan phosphoethanolaminetransferase (alkaline phosphatase superfamily)